MITKLSKLVTTSAAGAADLPIGGALMIAPGGERRASDLQVAR
jgi:hypothetical protein